MIENCGAQNNSVVSFVTACKTRNSHFQIPHIFQNLTLVFKVNKSSLLILFFSINCKRLSVNVFCQHKPCSRNFVKRMHFVLLFANHNFCFSGLKVMLISLYRSWREILLLVILLGIAVLVFGPLVYFMTDAINPEESKISSIPLGESFYSYKLYCTL